jgi:GH15 family glucan-1,4-alpha-glucosidase
MNLFKRSDVAVSLEAAGSPAGNQSRTDIVPELAARYPPISRLVVIGDRRTAAVIAADGSIQWFCLPDFDGVPVFARLLDAERGGYWRLGPITPREGRQFYIENTNVAGIAWEVDGGELELTDAMLLPQADRGPDEQDHRVLLRRLRCRSGAVACLLELDPRDRFGAGPTTVPVAGGFEVRVAGQALGLWTSRAELIGNPVRNTFNLAAGEEFWAIISIGKSPAVWSVEAAENALDDTIRYWRASTTRYHCQGPRRRSLLRAALAIELLSFAPRGIIAAAATSSLPERIGGDRNYDYRYAWIRDASMAMATLSVLGDLASAERYLGCISQLGSSTEMPVQVLYRVDGGTEIKQNTCREFAGYRGSRPVQFGNHAFRQRQLDCLGYLADCAVIYLIEGGRWAPEYWQLIRRIADYTAKNWRKPSNGIWEGDERRHYVSSKVMSWVTLKRTLDFADRTGDEGDLRRWRAAMTEIHADVMKCGWSEELQAFRRHYDADTLDASTLLVPLMGFLKPDHPRVVATVRRIEQDLMADGLVHRFRPENSDLSIVEFEGAFLPCCFWLAAVYALMKRDQDAEAVLRRVEQLIGDSGLFSEEADSRSGELLGNIPMIFSHAEYARAILQLEQRWPTNI